MHSFTVIRDGNTTIIIIITLHITCTVHPGLDIVGNIIIIIVLI